MAGVQKEIKTRFTVGGMREAAAGLRGFARDLRASFDEVKKKTADAFAPLKKALDAVEAKTRTVRKVLTGIGKIGGKATWYLAFKPLLKSLDLVLIATRKVGKELAVIGAKKAFGGIKLGAIGATAAIGGIVAKLVAVSTAAVKMSKETAAALKGISIDAERIGGSTEDVSVLGFAADQMGTDRDELVTQISTLSSEFLTLRENIAAADVNFQRFLSRKAGDLTLARDAGDRAAFWATYNGMKDDVSAERMKSISAIDERLAQIEANANQIEASGGMSTRGADLAKRVNDQRLAREIYELQEARRQIVSSQSPQGQAFFELQSFGLDQEAASKGGVQALLAISDAFKRVQDSSQKARIAAKLFGEDAGVKMIPLLNGGREAIERYRATLQESGAIATDADIAQAEAYTISVQRLKLAWQGLQLTVSRTLWPNMTRSADELTAWLLRNRTAISEYIAEAYRSTETLVKDIFAIISGRPEDIQTKWLDTVYEKALALKDVWADVKKQVSLLWQGKDSDYDWINSIRDGLIYVRDLAADAIKQFRALLSGQDTDYEWLNKLRDGVIAFGHHFSVALDIVKSGLKLVSDLLDPILSQWGVDIMSLGMAAGMARMLGVFALLTTAAKGLGGVLMKVFSLGGTAATAAAGAAAGAGGAAASAGASAAGAAATAAGLSSSLLRVGTIMSTLIKGAGLLGAALVGGFAAGQKAMEWWYQDTQEAYDKLIEAQVELIKAQDMGRVNQLLRDRSGSDKSVTFQQGFWADKGVQISQMTADQRAKAGRRATNEFLGWDENYDPYFGRDPAEVQAEDRARAERVRKIVEERERQKVSESAQKPQAVFQYDITLGGRSATVTGDLELKRVLDEGTRGFR